MFFESNGRTDEQRTEGQPGARLPVSLCTSRWPVMDVLWCMAGDRHEVGICRVPWPFAGLLVDAQVTAGVAHPRLPGPGVPTIAEPVTVRLAPDARAVAVVRFAGTDRADADRPSMSMSPMTIGLADEALTTPDAAPWPCVRSFVRSGGHFAPGSQTDWCVTIDLTDLYPTCHDIRWRELWVATVPARAITGGDYGIMGLCRSSELDRGVYDSKMAVGLVFGERDGEWTDDGHRRVVPVATSGSVGCLARVEDVAGHPASGPSRAFRMKRALVVELAPGPKTRVFVMLEAWHRALVTDDGAYAGRAIEVG